MNIVIISNSSNGLYLFRRQLISALIEKQDFVTILTPFDTDAEHLEELGATIIDTPMDRRGTNFQKDFALLGLYRRELAKLHPDLVITYTIKPNVYGGLVCRKLMIPYVTNITGLGTAFERSSAFRLFIRSLYKMAIKEAKVVFFENEANKRLFVSGGIIEEDKAQVLCGAGVDFEYFKYQPYPDRMENFRFLFIGRVMKEKGIDELLEAMELLRKNGFHCTLDILGYYDEDLYKRKIENKEEWLRYRGNQPDVRPFIRDCDCFVLPSYHEGMANTNLECAASGRPIITSNIPGCREAVIDGVSGLLCEAKSVSSLYEAMKKMLQTSEKERIKMGIAGRKHIIAAFDRRKVIKQTMQLLFGESDE